MECRYNVLNHIHSSWIGLAPSESGVNREPVLSLEQLQRPFGKNSSLHGLIVRFMEA